MVSPTRRPGLGFRFSDGRRRRMSTSRIGGEPAARLDDQSLESIQNDRLWGPGVETATGVRDDSPKFAPMMGARKAGVNPSRQPSTPVKKPHLAPLTGARQAGSLPRRRVQV